MYTDIKGLFMHTGNILTIPGDKMKTGIKSSEELLEGMRTCLSSGTASTSKSNGNMDVVCNTGQEPYLPTELLTNLKVFIKKTTPEVLRNALNKVLETLDDLEIDALIISYPEVLKDKPDQTLLDLWAVLEEYFNNHKVQKLGIADLETSVFVALHEQVKVKPAIFHISVQNCCIVPPDLQEFAKDHDIQLLTHNDPPDILPNVHIFNELKHLQPYWIARYQSHVKSRGVLAKKGYLLNLFTP